MNLFKTVKESVTVKQAVALYGLPITTTWMTRCPFHEDHTPSMKLNDTYYYCFGCGATGDVIDLTRPVIWSQQLPGSPEADPGLRTQPGQASIGCSRSAQASRCLFRHPARGNLLLSPGPPRLPRPADPVANRVCSPLPGGTAGRAFCRGSAHDGRCGRPY